MLPFASAAVKLSCLDFHYWKNYFILQDFQEVFDISLVTWVSVVLGSWFKFTCLLYVNDLQSSGHIHNRWSPQPGQSSWVDTNLFYSMAIVYLTAAFPIVSRRSFGLSELQKKNFVEKSKRRQHFSVHEICSCNHVVVCSVSF